MVLQLPEEHINPLVERCSSFTKIGEFRKKNHACDCKELLRMGSREGIPGVCPAGEGLSSRSCRACQRACM